jgi:outer membrane lipoprotein-sorting protein
MTRHLPFRAILALALALPLTGCLFRSHKVERNLSTAQLQTATKQQLIDYINTQASKIQSLTATVDIDTSVGGVKKGKVTDYREIRGYVLVRKPSMLRMIGLMPIVRNRAFDMVSDGQNFKLWIPPKNKFVMGRNDVVHPSSQPLENIRPQQIYDALLLQPIDPQNEIAILEMGSEMVEDPKTHKIVVQPDYELNVIRRTDRDWYLDRKIVFNRYDLHPDRELIYDQQGSLVTDTHYSDFRDYAGVQFPSVIRIWRPQEEYSILLKMVKLQLNQPLTDEQFALQPPPGAQLVTLDSTPESSDLKR